MHTSLRESDYLKTWTAFIVCATIGGFVAGFLVGAVLGIALKAGGFSGDAIKLCCGIAGFIAGLPVSYGFFRLFVSRMLIARTDRFGSEIPIQNNS